MRYEGGPKSRRSATAPATLFRVSRSQADPLADLQLVAQQPYQDLEGAHRISVEAPVTPWT